VRERERERASERERERVGEREGERVCVGDRGETERGLCVSRGFDPCEGRGGVFRKSKRECVE